MNLQTTETSTQQFLITKEQAKEQEQAYETKKPKERKKLLEKEILDLSIREAIAIEKLKEIRDKKKRKLELVVQCMSEMNMPLLEIMMGDEPTSETK